MDTPRRPTVVWSDLQDGAEALTEGQAMTMRHFMTIAGDGAIDLAEWRAHLALHEAQADRHRAHERLCTVAATIVRSLKTYLDSGRHCRAALRSLPDLTSDLPPAA